MSYKDKTDSPSQAKSALTRHSSLVTRLLLSFQFLTIIPVKDMGEVSEKDMGSASALFPLVGFAEGVVYAASAMLLLKIFPHELANGLVVLVMVAANGGLHLDGLSDTFDAVASRKDMEKKLAIMKDSTVGPFGVMAIVLVILLKYLSLNALVSSASPVAYYSLLFLMPVFSRWAMLPAIFHGKSARQNGLGRLFIEHTGKKELLTATLLTISCLLLPAGFVPSLFPNYSLFTVHCSLLLYLFSLAAVRFSNKHFGGMTGDTFGAVNEIAALIFLLSGVAWSRNFT